MNNNAADPIDSFDWIVVQSSAGKDSQAMLDYVAEQAATAGVSDRVVVVHLDLKARRNADGSTVSAEWEGTGDLAREQAEAYGFRFIRETRSQDGILDYTERRGKWPSSAQRWCTSDFKRGPGNRVLTALAKEWRAKHRYLARPCRIVNCFGFRAEESAARSKRTEWSTDKVTSNSRKTVRVWLPIHHWTATEVWARIKAAPTRHHEAYDLGMPRLSCCFCIMANRAALKLAGRHNPELLDAYCETEQKTGHSFKHRESLCQIRDEIRADIAAGKPPEKVADWTM